VTHGADATANRGFSHASRAQSGNPLTEVGLRDGLDQMVRLKLGGEYVAQQLALTGRQERI
jgi:hypothetical protein